MILGVIFVLVLLCDRPEVRRCMSLGQVNANKPPEVTRNVSVFKTTVIWMHPTPAIITATTSMSTNTDAAATLSTRIKFLNHSIDLTQLKLYYDNNMFFVNFLLALFVITPLGISAWLMKKLLVKCCLDRFCTRRASGNHQHLLRNAADNDISDIKSESALSGECGCVMRVRKDRRNKLNKLNKSMTTTTEKVAANRGKQLMRRENGQSKLLGTVSGGLLNSHSTNNKRAECILIKFKNSEPHIEKKAVKKSFKMNNNNNNNAVCWADDNSLIRMTSDESLQDYREFCQRSLSSMRKDLQDLEKI
jgi:hypothetical protein